MFSQNRTDQFINHFMLTKRVVLKWTDNSRSFLVAASFSSQILFS